MRSDRKTYSKSFKLKAVELSNARGNVQEVARELGIKAKYIYRWRKELNANPDLAFSTFHSLSITQTASPARQ